MAEFRMAQNLLQWGRAAKRIPRVEKIARSDLPVAGRDAGEGDARQYGIGQVIKSGQGLCH
jgi:hypothetical protein